MVYEFRQAIAVSATMPCGFCAFSACRTGKTQICLTLCVTTQVWWCLPVKLYCGTHANNARNQLLWIGSLSPCIMRTSTRLLCMQMPTEMGGGAGKVAFIDTEGTFRPERIRPIAQRFNLDIDAVLENVRGSRIGMFPRCEAVHATGCIAANPGHQALSELPCACRSCMRGHTHTSSRWVSTHVRFTSPLYMIVQLMHACA